MGLILLLPILFEWIAVNYEYRKTMSGVEESVLNRLFIYLLANIYVTVTSASLWDSLSDIIDKPSEALDILAQSLPTVSIVKETTHVIMYFITCFFTFTLQVVGYFVAFILTKILLGLPSTLLRWGDLSRYTALRFFFDEQYMTQREVDIVYRKQVIKYGREVCFKDYNHLYNIRFVTVFFICL